MAQDGITLYEIKTRHEALMHSMDEMRGYL